MKKNITLTVLLLVLAFAFSSCEKKKEWKYRYGYSIDDIVGEYTFSNIEGAFEDGLIENQDCHICPDAEISITKLTEKTVKLRINCPEAGFSREYIGTPNRLNVYPDNSGSTGWVSHEPYLAVIESTLVHVEVY